MKFFSQLGFVAFCLIQTTLSSPLEMRRASPVECVLVNDIVDLLKLVKATPFCSSFLSIPVVTVTSSTTTSTTAIVTTSPYTFTTVTLFYPTITDTITETSTTATTSPVVSTVTTDITDTITSETTSTVTETPPAKRDVEERAPFQLPPYLAGFASNAISTACSCLSIPQSTSHKATTIVTILPATAISSIVETQTTLTMTTTTTVLPTEMVIPETATATVSETTTVTSTSVATVCPNPIQDPGFEEGNPATPWVAPGASAYHNSEFSHSGSWAFLFGYASISSSYGPLPFSLSQEVTGNTCLSENPTLSFWARYDTQGNDITCSFQACIASVCTIFNAVEYMNAPGHNGYQQYSLIGPTLIQPTTMEISVSANGGSEGTCIGGTILFDDFLLS